MNHLEGWELGGSVSDIKPMDLFLVRAKRSFYGFAIRKLMKSHTNHNAAVFDVNGREFVLECSWPVNRAIELRTGDYYEHLNRWGSEWLVVRPEREFNARQVHTFGGYLMGFNYTRYALRDIYLIYKRACSVLLKWLPLNLAKMQKGKVYCTESAIQGYRIAGWEPIDAELPTPLDVEQALRDGSFSFVCGSVDLYDKIMKS